MMDDEPGFLEMVDKQDIVVKAEFTAEQYGARLAEIDRYVKQNMKDGIDYGVIVKGQKACLFKSGAEKMLELYGCKARFTIVDAVKDHEKGYYYFEYKCVILRKRDGLAVGEGIGSANTREKPHWLSNAYAASNTVNKMAQKRAMLQAVLISFGLSSKFTQDLEEEKHDKTVEVKVVAQAAVCVQCGFTLTDAVHAFSAKRYGKPLCVNCQKKIVEVRT